MRVLRLRIILTCLLFSALFAHAQLTIPRYEVGLHYVAQGDMGTFHGYSQGVYGYYADGENIQHGVGARFVYNLNRYVALEGEWNLCPESSSHGYPTTQYGGRPTEGLFGAKAGWRNRHVGFFLRVAPGYLSYGHAYQNNSNETDRVTHFRQYFGAVAEYYPSRHIAVRYDMGQTLTKYGSYGPVPEELYRDGHITAGVLYRF